MTTTPTRPAGAEHAFGTEPGDPARARTIGGPGERLDDAQVTAFVAAALADADLDGASVCLVVPDGTRTCPLPLLLGAVRDALAGRAREVTVVVALGTHQAMSEEHLARHLGFTAGDSAATYPGWTILNHASGDPETFVDLGTIGPERMAELTGGLMSDLSVDVRINRHVAEADVAVVVGPVFPHEVVGFSGGNKYFFPGVSGQELIDLSHWVGALITSAEMIGTRGVTPVRALVNEAAAMIPARRLALCLVVASGTDTLHAAAFGTPEDAWAACAAVSAETHVSYRDAPVRRVLSVMPTKYEDIWTAAKGFYKLEPVVADGGEVIIYAPHITEVSVMHPRHRRDRLPQPGLLPRPVGAVPRPALGRPGPLHAPARPGHLGPRARRAEPGHRDAGHRDPPGGGGGGEPALPRPRDGGRRRLRRRPRHLRRAPRRRGALPAAPRRRPRRGRARRPPAPGHRPRRLSAFTGRRRPAPSSSNGPIRA